MWFRPTLLNKNILVKTQVFQTLQIRYFLLTRTHPSLLCNQNSFFPKLDKRCFWKLYTLEGKYVCFFKNIVVYTKNAIRRLTLLHEEPHTSRWWCDDDAIKALLTLTFSLSWYYHGDGTCRGRIPCCVITQLFALFWALAKIMWRSR